MYPLNCRTLLCCFVSRLFSAAIRPHRFLLMALALLADLAWGGPVALAQTVTFNDQQTMVNQPCSVAVDGARRVCRADTFNNGVEGSAGGGRQTIMSGATNPSIVSSYVSFGGGTTAVPGFSLSRAASAASSTGGSLMADAGTLSDRKVSFRLANGALLFTEPMPIPGLILRRRPTLSATRLHATSALIGRLVAGIVPGANAQPQRNLDTIGNGSQRTRYWTLRRKIETASVTLFHMADAAQTCWHEANTPRWHEQNPMTPNSCQGASVVLVGSGPILQWASYRLTQRYPHSRLWAHVDHVIPRIEISISAISIRCSHTGSCNQHGF